MIPSMSAPYPLVRKRSDFSTSFGVSLKPSRSGSSPSSCRSAATRSCIRALHPIGLVMRAAAVAFPARAAEDPDALYANRTDLTSARRAAAIWQAGIDRNPRDFAAAWERAKAGYWLGGHESTSYAKDAAYEAGMAAARAAVAIAPEKPEGHFWLAANMRGYAAKHGMRGGLEYRGTIREEIGKVLGMGPGFLQGSADRALGRWYFKVPGLFGGSKQK